MYLRPPWLAVSKMVIRGPAPPTTGCELRSPIRPALAAAGLLVFLLIAQPLPALVTRAPPAEKETPKIVERGETALQAAEQRAASAWEMLANRGVSQMVPEIAAAREVRQEAHPIEWAQRAETAAAKAVDELFPELPAVVPSGGKIAEEAAKDARLVEMPSVSLGGVKRGFNSLLPEAQALYEAAVSYMNSDQAELERLQTKLSTLRGAERDLEVENQELRRGISITALEAAEAPG